MKVVSTLSTAVMVSLLGSSLAWTMAGVGESIVTTVETVASTVASLPATIYSYFFPDSDPQCSCGRTMPRDQHGHRVKRAINGEETGRTSTPGRQGSVLFLKLSFAFNRKKEAIFMKICKTTQGLVVAR